MLRRDLYDALVVALVAALVFAAWVGLSGEHRSIGHRVFDMLGTTAPFVTAAPQSTDARVPTAEPVAANPDGTFTKGECDYILGSTFNTVISGAKVIASTTVKNTGNVGIVLEVKAFWQETGHASLRDSKTVRLNVDKSARVNFSLPIPAGQLDGVQNAAFHNNWCGVHAGIVNSYGVPTA